MRIGLFTDCYFPNIGGAEVVVHNMATTFRRLGHEAVVMAPQRKGIPKENLPYELVTYHLFPARRGLLKTITQMAILLTLHKKFHFDVINIHKTYSGYYAGKVRGLLKTPIVITAHGGDIQKNLEICYGRRIEQPAWERKIAYAVQKADAVIAISRDSANCFRDLGVEEERIHRIVNGVDINRFSQTVELDREALGLEENDRIILAVGRYHRKKGYETLLHSMVLLKNKVQNAKLLIVGKRMEKLHSLARELAVEKNIIFIEEQKGEQVHSSLLFPNDFLLSLYKNAEIFVSSSIIEGFSLVCIEAMAAGLPLVLTKCPGNEDIFEEDGQGGYYVPVGDAEAMANKLTELLSNREKRESFAAFNKEYARQNYSIEIIARKYLQLFEEIVRAWKD